MDITVRRREKVKALLESEDLSHVMILNGGRGKFNTWLLGPEVPADGPPGMGLLPTLPPFNRSSVYIVPAEGDILRLSARQPHPTDAKQYPLLDVSRYPEVFGADRLGVVNPDCLKQTLLERMLAVNPALELVDLTDAFEALKAEKSPEEVEEMKAAAKLYDRAFSAMKLILREGRTEHDAAVEFRWRLAQLGVLDQDLGTLSVVRLTSAPDGGDAVPGPLTYPGRRLTVGDRINFSCTSFLPGGCSGALGRSYIMGKASDEAKRYWALAVEAQDLAASLAVPGGTLAEIEKAVNAFLTENSLPEDRSAWIYGIGCDRYEAPRNVDKTASLPLKAGMTLVIAPKVAPAGKDPYACMDVYAVAEGGAVRLSETSRELLELF